jgi:hypothetical protein
MRLSAASFAAAEKLVNWRLTPRRKSDPLVNVTVSLPKNSARMTDAAALKVLWPETQSGNDGVTRYELQDGSPMVAPVQAGCAL